MNPIYDPEGELTPIGSPEAEADIPEVEGAPAAATRSQVRREQRRVLFRSPGFVIGVSVVGFWVLAAIVPSLFSSIDFVCKASSYLAVLSYLPFLWHTMLSLRQPFH